MSPFAVKAIQLLLSLSILIVLHEMGHFIPAKLFKTRVEKFFLFFDVKFALIKKKIGDTVYGIGWLPLGGYVKISGMIDESMDKEQMAKPPQPWEFRSKPAWQRLIIMLGGVTVNILVGFIIYMGILYFYGRDITTKTDLPNGFVVAEMFKPLGFQDGDIPVGVNGKPLEDVTDINRLLFLRNVSTVTVTHSNGQTETLNIPNDIGKQMFKKGLQKAFLPLRQAVIDSVVAGEPAAMAGIQVGDIITAVNNEAVMHYDAFKDKVQAANKAQEPITIAIDRNGITDTLAIKPNAEGHIGVYNFAKELENSFTHRTYSLGESMAKGVGFGLQKLTDYVKQFKYVFSKEGATQIGGFGAIGNLFSNSWDWLHFWEITALLSIILAFMNILPIPALDGGHVLFLLWEITTGRKPGDKFLEYAQMVGFFLLIALVLFANGNDIYRWLFAN